MATRKNAHMYNSFKIVTGMSAFVKNEQCEREYCEVKKVEKTI